MERKITLPNKIKSTQPETPTTVQGRDQFQTPNYATELLVPYIPKLVEGIYEPACGNYKISNILEQKGYDVLSEDLLYGQNFLEGDLKKFKGHNKMAIITNPPFSLKKKFYERCMEYSDAFEMPWALLIPFDMCGWMIEAFNNNCQMLIPERRIDFLTPSGKSGLTGNTSNFHSGWLTWGFGFHQQMVFTKLTTEMKKNV
jgi:hypothetical protein